MNAIEALEASIRAQEVEFGKARKEFRQRILSTGESLRPSSIISKMIKPEKQNENEETQSSISPVDSAIGIATGFLSKKLLLGATHNPLLKLAGYLVQLGVTELVSRNPEQIKKAGNSVFKLFSGKKNNEDDTTLKEKKNT